MRHLTRDQLTHLHQELIQEKTELDKLFSHTDNFGLSEALSDSIGELSTRDNHPADIGSEVFERGKDLALNDHAEKKLMDVETALALFEKKEYGICARCGKPIPYERLEALPTATCCIEHSTDNHVSEDRPIEEEMMEPPFGRTSFDERDDETEFDGEDSWQAVASFGTSTSPAYTEAAEITDYDDLYIESDENVGYVEDLESFLATDIYGEGVFVVRNKAYYHYLDHKEGEGLLEPDPLPDKAGHASDYR
ncbi:TraR/DksA C4-type zinc finger protein [Gorillibacterium massiliense]|uniref:TraR/DksA C4-type zinc finger protein n=1 Tax=Gorillibacterium massiliense TaxID=1280390 RepID=UPI0004ACA166|nr:TraR/DksA C4-type zinc finger protein [Gorillibacterium massiliense]